MVRQACWSLATATHHTIFNLSARASARTRKDVATIPLYGYLSGYCFLLDQGFRTSCKVFGLEHLTNFGLALPSWPVFFVELHEADCRFDRLLFRFQLKLSEAADNLLGLD